MLMVKKIIFVKAQLRSACFKVKCYSFWLYILSTYVSYIPTANLLRFMLSMCNARVCTIFSKGFRAFFFRTILRQKLHKLTVNVLLDCHNQIY